MSLSEQEFAKVLDELLETGVSLSKLSEQVGLDRSTLHIAKKRESLVGDITKLARIVRSKAKFLLNYHPNKYSIDYLCREGLLKKTFLANEVGISRQALSQADELPGYREQITTNKIHSIGSKLDSLATRLEMVKD